MAIASEAFVVDDRYEVGDVIGRGGMGEVRRAHDRRLHRDVAIKFLRADFAVQDDARRRFEEEAQHAASLNHPNVVLVLDTGEFEGRPFLVMECLPGHTLHDALQRGPLREDQARALAVDVLGALVSAHEVGIVHRDVSPANILFTDDGRAKLADFGIAKTAEAESLTVVGQVLGTAAYLSPERLRGEPATPASDVYALGVTLYEALSGTKPFTGESPVAVAQAVLSTTPPPLASPLGALVAQAMAADPTQRPSAAELFAALSTDAEATTVVPVMAEPAMSTMAMPVVADRQPFRFRRGHAVIAVIAALLAGLLLLLTDSDPDPSSTGGDDPTTVPTTVARASTTVTSAPAGGTEIRVRTPIRVEPRKGKGKGGKN